MLEVKSLDAVKNQGKGRKVLLLLALVFVLPFTIAVLLHTLDIRPSGKSFGNLITPPVSLSIPLLQNAQGQVFRSQNWQKKWNIVMIADTACEDACIEKLDLLSRVHTSLNKDIARVQRILILPTQTTGDVLATLQKKLPDLIILSSTDDAAAKLAKNIEAAAPAQSVYLVDPLGNLMMVYAKKIEPKELRGDLVRLLKNSWAA